MLQDFASLIAHLAGVKYFNSIIIHNFNVLWDGLLSLKLENTWIKILIQS